MQISIRQRYKPFTHQPGVKVFLPGTHETHVFYPTTFGTEPMDGFTTLLDLEKGEIVVFGKKTRHIIKNSNTASLERISFGVHKKQEWEGIHKRCDVQEFLPLWYHMSQWYAEKGTPPKGSLLEACFLETDKINLTKQLKALFTTGFSNLLFPQSVDSDLRGYPLQPLNEGEDPTLLFSLGKKLIRSFFFRKEDSVFSFLPLVPKEIHCGRFLNIQEDGMKMDFEWTKHEPRRLFIEVKDSKERTFAFPKEIKEFRIKSLNRRCPNFQSIQLEPGRYLFDQFKK